MADPKLLTVLEQSFGLTGQLTRLPGENENYAITNDQGEKVVCKVSAAFDHLQIEQEAQVMQRVAKATEFRVPVFKSSYDGSLCVAVDDERHVIVLEFVEGTPWGEAGPLSVDMAAEIGRALGCVSMALEPLGDDSFPRTHNWDLCRAGQHRDKIPFVSNLKRRRILESVFHQHAAISGVFPSLPWGWIHGDANEENVLVDGEHVTGLLDFGDCILNPLICEVAIALAYVMQLTPNPFECAQGLLKGYESIRGIQSAERHILFPLILARLAVTVSMCAHRRTIDPDRESWFVSEETAWTLLEDLWHVSPAEGTACLWSGAAPEGTTRDRHTEAVLEQRQKLINPSLSLAYPKPIHMARGRGQYLFDIEGRPYLDLVNNVCHVGHCHSHVVERGQRQMELLNTNTRYVYDELTEYAERLAKTLPDPLEVCFFVNSGTEANEVAIRLARAYTGRKDMLVVDGAYHGHTSTLISISPYKFMGPGGRGEPEDWVHVVPVADGYRGKHKGQGRETGLQYAADVRQMIADMENPPAAFMSESLLSCGGQIIPPEGYFEQVAKDVRDAGGLMILDEVQVGFGRAGRSFWAFENFDVVPDIVVMGKPIGNGHPMAAVVTTRAIADAFNNGMEYFATFGGNPVSCAIGMAVLDVIETENLQEHADTLGRHFLRSLEALKERHAVIGDVRGLGLFVGIEFVHDRETLEPAKDIAVAVVNQMKERGMLLTTDGPFGNVIKIKPPMVLDQGDVDMVVRSLSDVLLELGHA